MIGTMIGQYKVLAKLGEGGMGSVYKALDVNLDRPVALKFVNADIASRQDMVERFRAEARTHASLHHPNIATLYAFLVWEGKAVMVMEYIDGETLHDRIERTGLMPVEESVPLVRQALLGLAAAHRQGIVHRDIKPQNLMIDRGGVVKVMDFGIAKVQGRKGLTGTNTIMGTFWYMSPEQIRGRTDIDARTDIYSMGATLYQVLTGRVPFDANSDYEIQRAHIEQVPEKPNLHNPRIPEYLVQATMRALTKSPEDRFQTAETFHAALEGHGSKTLTEMPVYRPATVIEQPAPKIPGPGAAVPEQPEPVRGGRAAMYGIVAAVLLSGAGGVVWWRSAHKPAETVASYVVKKTPPVVLPPTGGGPPAKPPAENGVHGALDRRTHPTHMPVPREPPAKNGNVPSDGTEPSSGEAGTDRSKTVVPPPPPVMPGRELSGLWSGAFLDPGTQQSTQVKLQLTEDTPLDLHGSLQFVTPTQDRGTCQISAKHSSFNETSGQLVLSIVGCNGAESPKYFNTPIQFEDVGPTNRQLRNGHPKFANTSVTANLSKLSSMH